MKRILLAMAMMIALPALILCQTNGKSAGKEGGDEQAVRQVVNELAAAVGSNDIAALDRIYADGFTFVSDTGVLSTKAQRLAAMKSSELKYQSVVFDDVNVRVYGNTAVATFRVTSKFQLKGQDFSGQYMVTGTFLKIKGRWQEIAVQSTRIGEQ